MKYLVKIFIFLFLVLSAVQMQSQVAGLRYAVLLNSSTILNDCYLSIKNGQANSIQEKDQFNAQYSFLMPPGVEVNVENCYMSQTYHQNFSGELSLKWNKTSKLRTPYIHPKFDFNQIRAFDFEIGLKSYKAGMRNRDFLNGLILTGYQQLFERIKNLNQEEANYTSLDN